MRNLPGFPGQFLDRLERHRIEHIAALGLDGDQDVVVLGVDLLELLEVPELGVLRLEEITVVVLKAQILRPA